MADVNNILQSSSNQNEETIPVKSQFLWFRANKGYKQKKMEHFQIPLIKNKTAINFDLAEMNRFFKNEGSVRI